MAPSLVDRPLRVKKSPVAFECRHLKTIEVPMSGGGVTPYSIVLGEVVSIYIDDFGNRRRPHRLVQGASGRPPRLA
jgi:flavin reductase (DIM6/NTAB) family NADH-FMN oxidoreductase RutF